MDEFKFFLPVSKVEKNKDGSRTVTGYASTPTKDLDGEVITLKAVKDAMPAYMEWRNIRLMHQPVAIGTAKEASVDDVGLYVKSRIVDDNAIKLLDEGVLKGYSIGGKKLAQKGSNITSIELVEISLVDRPANPDCKLDSITKFMKDGDKIEMGTGDGTEPETPSEIGMLRKMVSSLLGTVADFGKKLKEEPHAMQDGSFPIQNESDLKNAIKALPRAKDQNAASAHIKTRAKALGLKMPEPKADDKAKKGAFDFAAQHPEFFGEVEIEAIGYTHDDEAVDTLMGEVAEVMGKAAPARFAKGMYTVRDLSDAFNYIRSAQRCMISEGNQEKDEEDFAMAKRLGELAVELASVISQKAAQEGSEARYLTDSEDRWMDLGDYQMNAQNGDLAKRAASALGKVDFHIRKAGASQALGTTALKAAGKAMLDVAKAAATGSVDTKATLALLKSAFDHFTDAESNMELAHVSLAKVGQANPIDGTGIDTGGKVTNLSHSSMADAPWYGSVSEDNFAGKAATVGPNYTSVFNVLKAAGIKMTAESLVAAGVEVTPEILKAAGIEVPVTPATNGMVSSEMAALMVKAAVSEAQVALLSRQPAGPRRAAVHSVEKLGFGSDQGDKGSDMAKALMDGVDIEALNASDGDEETQRRAMGRIIGNMVSNPNKFAKSIFDPSFRGMGGQGKH